MHSMSSDLVELAHLALIRGDKQRARTMLEQLLAADPANSEALLCST